MTATASMDGGVMSERLFAHSLQAQKSGGSLQNRR